RDSDDGIAAEVGVTAAKLVEHRVCATAAERDECAERLIAAIDERRPAEGGDATFERVVHAQRGDDEVRRVEVAAEPPRAAFDDLAAAALGELLEEVLNQVLLGQPVEHLGLLDRD